MSNKPIHQGFTLFELITVLAIIAVIAALAYPSYTNSVTKTRRADAKAALLSFAQAMERHYTENNSYLGASISGNTGAPSIFPTEAPLDGSAKFYDLTIQSATDTTFTLRATPKGSQADDGIMEILNTQFKRWDKNNNGSFASDENTWDQG